MKYNWAAYYRKAYEAEKKKNTLLAGKVADAEGKKEELQAKYAAIRSNPLYRVSQFPSLCAGGFRKMKHMASVLLRRGVRREVPSEKLAEFTEAYQERLHCQRDSYSQWIREKEPALWERYRGPLEWNKELRRRRCQVISYREFSGVTDLSVVVDPVCADILLFVDHPKELDERAVSYIEEWFSDHPETKLLYGAEDHIAGGKRCFPWFKPCWSPDTLLGFFYFGSYFAVDRAWAEQISLSGDVDAWCNLYYFVLQLLKPYFQKPAAVVYDKRNLWQTGFYFAENNEVLSEQPSGVGHLSDNKKRQGTDALSREREELSPADDHSPEIICLDLVLYHRNSTADFEMPVDREYYLETGKMRKDANPEYWGFERKFIKLKEDFINGMGYECFSCQTLHPDVWSVVPVDESRGKTGNTPGSASDGGEKRPLVSAVILSKDHPELLQNCIDSFVERTSLPGLQERVEFIVVDNGSSEENRQTIQRFLESVKAECHYIYRPMDFNFSAMCNVGVCEAKGKYILLLNDDVEIVEGNWLRVMLGQALMPGTGAVGAKLWYPKEERIQHAGVTNMHIGPSHKLTTFPDDRTYYYGHNTVTYDMMAVTAACLLVRKSVYEEVGGLDEEMAVAYNDVDFCFKLAEAGYRNVLRNDAVLLHHESASRGIDDLSEEKWHRLIQEKTNLYDRHPLFHKFDPYYSEQLADNAPDYHIGYHYPYERLLSTAVPEKREGKEELRKAFSSAVMLTVERAGKQHKIYLEDPDIVEAEGWCYMLWQDNCLFERWLVLESEQEDFYYRAPVKERLRPDVEAILPQQKNIELSGFVCRILKEDLASGDYRIGMLYQDRCSGRLYYGGSNSVKL